MARDLEGYLGLCWKKEKHFKQQALGRKKEPRQLFEGP